MARCCGNSGNCNCQVQANRHVTVTGTGQPSDPYVIEVTTDLDTQDNGTFNLVLTGAGTLDSPWLLEVQYSGTARLDDHPEVVAAAPSNGQVLGWDSSTSKWTPRNPTTASAGSVLTGNGIEGDGSGGSPLEVTPDTVHYLTVRPGGVGISDAGINRMLRIFPDAAARTADSLVPDDGTLSMLLDAPGLLDYWTGTDWEPVPNNSGFVDGGGGQLLGLSGPYAGGPTEEYHDYLTFTTDGSGDFTVIDSTLLASYAGVLSAVVQPVGTVAWQPSVRAGVGEVLGRAFRLTDGTAMAGATLTATVTARLY